MAPLFTDEIVFESDLIRIGAFRCSPEYASFQDTGPVSNDCFVFPRTAVAIEHEHEPAFVANANIVTFYNQRQEYRRHRISEHGDRCDWFGVERSIARDAVRETDPSVEDAPFRWTRGRCDSRTYLLQRRLFQDVTTGVLTDPLAIEETVFSLLARVVGGRSAAPQRSLIHDVEHLLATHFDQPLRLKEIANRTGTSVYHLCRAFRKATGLALHQYLRQLRIRSGLEPVYESNLGISRIAVDLGFTHHSHFTSAFRREFGVTPSQLRSV